MRWIVRVLACFLAVAVSVGLGTAVAQPPTTTTPRTNYAVAAQHSWAAPIGDYPVAADKLHIVRVPERSSGNSARIATVLVAAETVDEGIYVVRSEAGNYVGQSGNITQRLAQHVSTGKFTQAEIDAAERFAVSGGKTAREIAEQLKIDSPEFGGIDNLLNKVNPIGTRRLDLMPDGYTR